MTFIDVDCPGWMIAGSARNTKNFMLHILILNKSSCESKVVAKKKITLFHNMTEETMRANREQHESHVRAALNKWISALRGVSPGLSSADGESDTSMEMNIGDSGAADAISDSPVVGESKEEAGKQHTKASITTTTTTSPPYHRPPPYAAIHSG